MVKAIQKSATVETTAAEAPVKSQSPRFTYIKPNMNWTRSVSLGDMKNPNIIAKTCAVFVIALAELLVNFAILFADGGLFVANEACHLYDYLKQKLADRNVKPIETEPAKLPSQEGIKADMKTQPDSPLMWSETSALKTTPAETPVALATPTAQAPVETPAPAMSAAQAPVETPVAPAAQAQAPANPQMEEMANAVQSIMNDLLNVVEKPAVVLPEPAEEPNFAALVDAAEAACVGFAADLTEAVNEADQADTEEAMIAQVLAESLEGIKVIPVNCAPRPEGLYLDAVTLPVGGYSAPEEAPAAVEEAPIEMEELPFARPNTPTSPAPEEEIAEQQPVAAMEAEPASPLWDGSRNFAVGLAENPFVDGLNYENSDAELDLSDEVLFVGNGFNASAI
ncbi:MAG TPA: hypothetical protein VLE89_08615 [Chlamydiales bacterium]|nr:hypothetical protein [Chlamydiales bacterium]